MSSITVPASDTPAPSDTKLAIPYGVSVLSATAGEGALSVAIGRAQRMPLRLWHGPYPFAEPPDLTRLKGTAERMAFIKEHLKSLCGLWAKPPLDFLDAYFRWIDSTLESARAGLEARGGGLFQPRDWGFAAFRPLPLAHLPVAVDRLVRTDFAFWTGDRLAAVELVGESTPRRQRREELDALRQAGVAVIDIPVAQLAGGDLAALLPPSFARFWEGVELPKSPFGPAALAEIQPAPAVLGATVPAPQGAEITRPG
ncbi:MAG TPA: hypothetical protein VK690_04385 [Stellaceae bacterium]|nr:hypothetical protein [Stellaceae bacterium]